MTNKKQLLNFPDYFITKDGQVFKGDEEIAATERIKNGIKFKQVSLFLNGKRFTKRVDTLLEEIYNTQYQPPSGVMRLIHEAIKRGESIDQLEQDFDIWINVVPE